MYIVHSNDIQPGWHVKARDLRPGDIVQQFDWPSARPRG
jgi:hypothetical protein